MKNFKKVLSLALAAMMVIGGLVFAPVDAKAENAYTKVTSADQIAAGKNIVLVAKYEDATYAMGIGISSKITAVPVTIDSNNQLSGITVPVWTVGTNGEGISLSNGQNYLGVNSDNNFTKVDSDATLTATEQYNVAAGSEDGTFRFLIASKTTRGIGYQNSGIRFGNYAVSNDGSGYQFDLQVYLYNGTITPATDFALDANATPEQIVNGAYEAMYKNVKMTSTHTLTGLITVDGDVEEDVATITMVVEGLETLPIQCYQLDCANLTTDFEVNGTVTVEGTFGYYNGKVQFNSGSVLKEYTAPASEPVELTDAEIVDAVYALENNAEYDNGNKYDLTGKVISVDTGYNSGKITVTIVVEGRETKPIQCYNLTASDAVTDVSKVTVGDTITAKGALKNFKGTKEFNGCTLEAYTAGTGAAKYNTEAELVAAAKALETGYGIAGIQTLNGKFVSISGDEGYETIVFEACGEQFQVYRPTSDCLDKLVANETEITVTGNIVNYKGTVQFVRYSTLTLKGEELVTEIPVPEGATSEAIVALAQTLTAGQSLIGTQTITGVISEFKLTYNPDYTTIAFWITVGENKLLCYGISGEGIDKVAVGDTVTVSGPITHTYGSAQVNYGSLDSYELADKIEVKGDVTMPFSLILFAGVALLAVSVIQKKKFV